MTVTLRTRHITTVIVTLNTPHNSRPCANLYSPSPNTRDHGNTRTLFIADRHIFPLIRKVRLSSTRKVHVYFSRKRPSFLLTGKSMFTFTRNIYVITRKNVLRLIDRRNVVVKPRRRLALAHRSTQIWQHVWHDRSGVRLGDAITQRRVITFWR